jgi:hypothetical protein
MSGRPRRGRLVEALERRAHRDLGEGATPLDFVVGYIAAGAFLSALAVEVSKELGEPVSRPFLSGTVHSLAPDAKSRIETARREAAHALAEEATTIADSAPATSAGVQKAKLQSDTRRWLAERFDPGNFGSTTKTEVSVSLGHLHLEALRHRAALVNHPATALATVSPELMGGSRDEDTQN